ncbi:metal-dependent hydrolase [Paenibacillus sp. FJAT-27812]|uniref:metal-dependent hydrolase n=1 Tax=Paenibacillus sp. FJAT-27812 TaxID=1684143 RepID=UPI0006A78477|nr:hypothetical protein [Paenibacillus sp. FJAT-27812]
MFAGHFGLAAAVKAMEPQVPLWALMASTQLMDIVFISLLLSGVESLEPIGDGGYGKTIIHADYTHSLVGALLRSAIACFIAWRIWNMRSAIVIGSLTFSHWLIDLVVHRSDMPFFPGNWGDLPLLGFQLWQFPAISAAAEIVLVLIGAILYFRSVIARAKKTEKIEKKSKAIKQAYGIGSLMAFFLVLTFVTDYLGL